MEGLKELLAAQQGTVSTGSITAQLKEWAGSLNTSPAGKKIVGFKPATNGAKVCAVWVEGFATPLLVRAGAVEKIINGDNVAEGSWVTQDGYLMPRGEVKQPSFA